MTRDEFAKVEKRIRMKLQKLTPADLRGLTPLEIRARQAMSLLFRRDADGHFVYYTDVTTDTGCHRDHASRDYALRFADFLEANGDAAEAAYIRHHANRSKNQ